MSNPSSNRACGRRAWRTVAALALACAPPAVGAQAANGQLSAYVTVTSDYRHRGLSQSRGEPSVHLGGDFQHRSGFFAGAWLATIEYLAAPSAEPSGQREVGVYAGYNRRVGAWSLAGMAAHYAYPDGSADYDYLEWSGTAAYRDRVFLTATYTDDLFARRGSAVNVELGGALPLPAGFELGATLGRFESDGDVGYTHFNVGLSKTFARRVGVDVRYYDTSRYISGPFASSSGDEWVVSASYGFSAR